MKDHLKTIISEGYIIRSKYYAAIELSNEQQLGMPASEEEVSSLEMQTGKRLPISYREFLLLHNGWKQVSGAIDLLSTSELLSTHWLNRITDWQNEAKRFDDIVAARSVVIGMSLITPTVLLLDPHTINQSGEWALIQHHKDEEIWHESFMHWLETANAGFSQMLDSHQKPPSETRTKIRHVHPNKNHMLN
jgi:SMI1 / KNR4 family (SUKH-1)